MIQLFVNNFRTGIPERDAEFDEVFRLNCANPFIEKIWCIGMPPAQHEKAIWIHSDYERPTFQQMFYYMAGRTTPDDVNILANLDIYFDETIELVNRIQSHECFALTRWDIIDGVPVFFNRGDSQDCWIFRGAPPDVEAGFEMGRVGCDNVIAEILNLKRPLRNPSLSIKALHIHNSGVRNKQYMDFVHGGYKTLSCEEI